MSAPLTSLFALVVLAAVASLAAADDEERPGHDYVTVTQKGPVDRQLDESLGPFYIPHGQCSGVLDAVLSCPAGGPVEAVRVRVQDATPYPRVALADSLRGARVLRAPPCRGEAAVSVRLACHPPLP